VYVPLAFAAGTLTGIWAALLALMAVRLVTVGWRYLRRRWIVLGVTVQEA
jgi:Na+-driven multidrug efflux pump